MFGAHIQRLLVAPNVCMPFIFMFSLCLFHSAVLCGFTPKGKKIAYYLLFLSIHLPEFSAFFSSLL